MITEDLLKYFGFKKSEGFNSQYENQWLRGTFLQSEGKFWLHQSSIMLMDEKDLEFIVNLIKP
ncbi:hypothetical protein [Xanthovirga aplysinae]|uniref:hypothetical protein n=1 Tax=Xanthovirga aplysinae TaxID=2529853 RepID=UPI0012BC7F45|nr:hypothetical protein [Xanthovirga aplysinae]MTI31078.1 hypothetical protein [Xanthovirga aplysinae]